MGEVPQPPVTAHERAQAFVDLHDGDSLFVMANPTTVGVAATLEQLGFAALGTSSAALARSFGREDGETSRNEAIDHAVAILNATTVPVSGDFENGYGDTPEEVAETIRRSLDAGLSGCCIEDASGDSNAPIYDAGLARDRIAAAADAVGSHPFVLVARAENHLHGRADLADTIARLQSFAEAGASALYAPGITELGDLETVVNAVPRPLNVLVGLPGQPYGLDDLGAIGVRRVSVGSGFDRVANAAIEACATALLDGASDLTALFRP